MWLRLKDDCMVIELIDVFAGYRKGGFVLRGVNLRISSNTIVLGPNGSGKTTLLRAIIGTVVSRKGRVVIDGVDVDSINGSPGLVSANLPELVIRSRLPVKHIASLYLDLVNGDYDHFKEIVSRIGEENALDKGLHELSAGLRIVVLNALALAAKAKYILLDEPFENLDPARRVAMLHEIVKSSGIKVMATHTTWLLRTLDVWDIYLIVEGLIYGSLKQYELIELKISREPISDAVLSIKLRSGSEVYLSRRTGVPLSSLDSLDELYEVLTWQY
jgi:ABC-type Mn2+/Zn2+ transport system ATPase subunit